MPRSDTDYAALPVAVLSESYRTVAEAIGLPPVRRFHSKAEAVARLEAALDQAIATGRRISFYPNGAVSAVREPRTRAKPQSLKSIVVDASGHNDNHTIQSIVVDPNAVRPDATSLELGRRIRVLSDNPKRPGSHAHSIYSLYQDGMTGAQFVQAVLNAGYTRRTALDSLRWDISRGYIRLFGRR